MDSDGGDADRLRDRQAEADDQASRGFGVTGRGTMTMVAQTKTMTTYPTSAQRYFACTPAKVLGTETEGVAGSITVPVSASTFYALNLGTTIPPAGTTIVCTYVEFRWVFRYG